MMNERNGRHKSQYLPIILMGLYIVMFFFTDLQIYADKYDIYVAFLDSFLFTLSILYYFSDGRKWSFLGKKSLVTALALNVLTEMSFIFDMPQYYWFYSVIIFIYFLSLMIESYTTYKNKNNPNKKL